MKREVGMRVFAVLSATNKEVSLIGKGEYLGDRPLSEAGPDAVGPFGLPVSAILEVDPEHKNPCIKLDNGEIVWGFECWWGPEEELAPWVGDRTIVNVDMKKARERN